MMSPHELLRRLGMPSPTETDLRIGQEIIEDILESAARVVERTEILDGLPATIMRTRAAARVRLSSRATPAPRY